MPWQLNGNSGTNGSTNYLGTTDNQPLVIRTNGTERGRITRDGNLAVRQNATIGAGSNGTLKVRHIDGKDWQSDADDGLYLNWATGKLVQIGQPGVRAPLYVSGDAVVGAGSNGTLKVRHIDGKDWQSDADDALYLNWATGRPVVLGQSAVRCDLQVNGNIQVLGDIALQNADCAEEFTVSDIDNIEPGTLMVLDEKGVLRPSTYAYDRRVAGVVSGAGNCRPALILDKQERCKDRLPIALIGKVYCKADAEHSPIGIGDLLTTSSTAGHAMKVTDPTMAFGAVIGKAMANLMSGRALIPILATLQ
jgi:hypothetical protein